MRHLLNIFKETLVNNSSTNSNVSASNNNLDSKIDRIILALILTINLFIIFYIIIFIYRLKQRAIHDNLMLEVGSVDSGYADIEDEDIDEEIDEGARIVDVDDSVERTVNERVTLNVHGQINSEEDEVVVRIY
ncbi:hypothetical protein PGAL8A_00272900 [Plasmodium gallinaceum]|uniref:Uncharacterized protein n=1 Tax=Plasmodium gallinaceum TaxID=5849 RepID=A0A1J1GSS3_PLAGA|nr:hypothetical protein PGAL8A_00272900 [Plasmodium gallinaceum]CRG95529.1 hypothetical protein PGAL8A_00272900 [Plasmodium gallinaceum]